MCTVRTYGTAALSSGKLQPDTVCCTQSWMGALFTLDLSTRTFEGEPLGLMFMPSVMSPSILRSWFFSYSWLQQVCSSGALRRNSASMESFCSGVTPAPLGSPPPPPLCPDSGVVDDCCCDPDWVAHPPTSTNTHATPHAFSIRITP